MMLFLIVVTFLSVPLILAGLIVSVFFIPVLFAQNKQEQFLYAKILFFVAFGFEQRASANLYKVIEGKMNKHIALMSNKETK